MGAFSAKFSMTPSGKTIDGTQKCIEPKMMAWTTSITVQNLVEIARRTSAWEDEMWCFSLCLFVFCFFFENSAVGRRPLWCVVELLPQDIASAVDRFRCGLQLSFGEEKPFSAKWTDLKTVARWGYDTYRNARENFQNLRKWGQSLCAPLRPFSRSKMKENFYHSLLPHIL